MESIELGVGFTGYDVAGDDGYPVGYGCCGGGPEWLGLGYNPGLDGYEGCEFKSYAGPCM